MRGGGGDPSLTGDVRSSVAPRTEQICRSFSRLTSYRPAAGQEATSARRWALPGDDVTPRGVTSAVDAGSTDRLSAA